MLKCLVKGLGEISVLLLLHWHIALNTEEILLTHGIPSPTSGGSNFINCCRWSNLTTSNIYSAATITACGYQNMGICLCISCNFGWDYVDDKCELNWGNDYGRNWYYNCSFCDLSSNKSYSKALINISGGAGNRTRVL